MPTSSSHQPTSGSLSSHLSTSTSSLTPTRNSSRSHPSPRPGDWEQVPDQRGMATIVEGPQDYGPQRTASMDDKVSYPSLLPLPLLILLSSSLSVFVFAGHLGDRRWWRRRVGG